MHLKTAGKWIGIPAVFVMGLAVASLWPRHDAQAMPAGEGSGKWALLSSSIQTDAGAAAVTLRINTDSGEAWVLETSNSNFLHNKSNEPLWTPIRTR